MLWGRGMSKTKLSMKPRQRSVVLHKAFAKLFALFAGSQKWHHVGSAPQVPAGRGAAALQPLRNEIFTPRPPSCLFIPEPSDSAFFRHTWKSEAEGPWAGRTLAPSSVLMDAADELLLLLSVVLLIPVSSALVVSQISGSFV